MTSRFVGACLVAGVGALAGVASLGAFYSAQPAIVFEMDSDVPASLRGFYPVERSGTDTFVWTRGRAELAFAGLDRRSAWVCTIRLKGARPDPALLPVVRLAVDGIETTVRTASNDYADIDVPVAPRPARPGLILTLVASPTFTPGKADPRTLGVMVDRVACVPATSAVALPPRAALAGAGISAAAMGTGFVVVGLGVSLACAAAAVVAVAQAVPLATGVAVSTAYVSTAMWTAVIIAIFLAGGTRISEWTRGKPLHDAVRFVAIVSAVALYLKILGLLHPGKHTVDALFQAHRLGWVLAGRLYFTSLTPSLVEFPYGISLYLAAAPFAFLTRDHVSLLRIVVATAEAASGLLLYLMIVRSTGDRLRGAVAVLLYHLVPLSFGVVGAGNLTNAFGEALALAVVASVTVCDLTPARWFLSILLTVLVVAAFVSHTGTASVLATTLAALAAVSAMAGPAHRARAVVLAGILSAGLALATLAYYGHFSDVYRQAVDRLTSSSETRNPRAVDEGRPGPGRPAAVRRVRRSALWWNRLRAILPNPTRTFGWPISLLAVVGLWRVWRNKGIDRLTLALAAWAISCLVFTAMGVLTPVRMRYYYSTAPAVVILAATAAAWALRQKGWRAGTAVVLVSAALVTGGQAWLRWFV